MTRRYVQSGAQRDEQLLPEIERVWTENFRVYGVRKGIWRQLHRERMAVARCTVARLMRRVAGLRGVVRGKTVRTTVSQPNAPCPRDHVQRQFRADRPNQLWVSDLTYVSTCQGIAYVAFVIDVYVRRIVGWRSSTSARGPTSCSMRWNRRCMPVGPIGGDRLIHHSDRGSQYCWDSVHRAACGGWPGAFCR